MSKKENQKVNLHIPEISKWYLFLAIGCLLAIAAHLIIRELPLEPRLKYLISNSVLWFIIAIGGIPVIGQIFLNIFKGEFGVDVLATVSVVLACYLGEYLAATLVILMLTGGQALEAYALRKASSVLLALVKRMPSLAHRKDGEFITDIELNDIAIGDSIVIYPHETSPVDGTVIEGHSTMDESYLTGEPYQVSKAPGSSVLSGTVNGESVLLIKADRAASDSRYAKIMKVMEEAEQKRPQLRRMGDQLGAFFAPFALAIAFATLALTGDLTRFLSVLIVATPCPLLIAIPITLISAISISAKNGLIIKDPTVLERLPTCKVAIFDKTGTLTYGEPELAEIITAPGVSSSKLLQQIASLERYSKHPLAGAVVKAATGLFLLEAESVSEKPGQGIVGMVSGDRIRVTSRKNMLELDPKAPLPVISEGLECIVLINDSYAATLKFRDKPREDGKTFIGHLTPKHAFKKIMIVSGDRESEVAYLAKTLGIMETFSSQSPEQKLEIIRTETAKLPTLYLGDGINDAPALAAATVGIAFGQHCAVTSEAAGAVILESSLAKVDELMHISASMRTIALQSAVGGMLLSILGMGFAAFGLLSPVAGALSQEVIDIVAILNALRLVWQKNIATDLKVRKKL